MADLRNKPDHERMPNADIMDARKYLAYCNAWCVTQPTTHRVAQNFAIDQGVVFG